MHLGGIGTRDENDIGIFEFFYGIGHNTASKCCGQTGHGG
jgi:hypothetical protein